MTPEMLNLHQFISELETAEENMLENHRQYMDQLLDAYNRAQELLRNSDTVAYDQEGKVMLLNFKILRPLTLPL